ncbi:MAG: hypothetical protein B7X11_04400, partial [Acidobacteria bacterium 37-65-4]
KVSNKRYSESLRDNRDLILKSKDLASIRTDVPVNLDLKELRMEPPDRPAVVELFKELEFHTLLKEYESTGGESAATPAKSSTDPPQPAQNLKSPDAVKAWVDRLRRAKQFAVAVSAETGNSFAEDSFKLGLAIGEDEAALVEIGEKDLWKESGLQDVLEDDGVAKQTHDCKDIALRLAREAAVTLRGVCDDTMLMSYLLDANESNHTLERVARQRLEMELPPGPDAAAAATARLTPLLRKEIEALELKAVYETMELPLAAVLTRMEQAGVRVDETVLAGLSAEFESKLIQLTADIYRLAGTEFNINSPKQLGEVLFEKLNLPSGKKSKKSGQYSTAIDVLEELGASYDLPRLILEYRQISKLKSTYVDALPRLIDARTGRIHTSFNQTVAATGRLSSTEPNLQNIPIRS